MSASSGVGSSASSQLTSHTLLALKEEAARGKTLGRQSLVATLTESMGPTVLDMVAEAKKIHRFIVGVDFGR